MADFFDELFGVDRDDNKDGLDALQKELDEFFLYEQVMEDDEDEDDQYISRAYKKFLKERSKKEK